MRHTFYLEKRNKIDSNVPVFLSVTYSKLRMIFYTGLRCNRDQWDLENMKLKRNQILPNGTNSQNFNSELVDIESKLNDLFKGYASAPPSPEQLRTDLKIKLGKLPAPIPENLFDKFDKYVGESGLSANRKKILEVICRKLKASQPAATFDNIDLQKFKNDQSETLSKNSMAMYLNGLKSFIRHAAAKGYTTNDPFKSFEYSGENYGKPIYITIAERDQLYDAAIRNKALSTARDIFVFQCFVGCRYGDLQRFTRSNIIITAECPNGCLQYIAAKTKKHEPRVANVPLSTKAKAILSKYQLDDGRILPYMCTDYINRLIKRLFKQTGLTRMVTIKDKVTGIDKQVSLDRIASTHMARRVFIGSLHKMNVKNETIASMSGHSRNSRAFSRYYDIDAEEQKNAMALIE